MVGIVPPGKTIFVDSNGVPLQSGFVYFYAPGTTSLSPTWTDQTQAVANPNPVRLDLSGGAYIWGSGTYRQVVTDALGNQIWDTVSAAVTAAGATVSITSIGAGLSLSTAGQLTTAASTISAYITATGNVQSTAFLITSQYNVVTGGAAGTGILLNQQSPVQQVLNRTGNSINIWPWSSAQIENGAVNGSVSLAYGASATFIQASNVQIFQCAV